MTDQPRRRGRPPGSKNRAKLAPVPEGQEFEAAQNMVVRELPRLIEVLVDSALDDRNVDSAKYLINRALGKPTEKSEITAEIDQRIEIEYVNDWRGKGTE